MLGFRAEGFSVIWGSGFRCKGLKGFGVVWVIWGLKGCRVGLFGAFGFTAAGFWDILRFWDSGFRNILGLGFEGL